MSVTVSRVTYPLHRRTIRSARLDDFFQMLQLGTMTSIFSRTEVYGRSRKGKRRCVPCRSQHYETHFRRANHDTFPMPDFTSKLREILIIIYEMEGRAGVENYAEANGIPVAVCRKLIDAYALESPSLPKPRHDAGLVRKTPDHDDPGFRFPVTGRAVPPTSRSGS
jgi:hypothetical protein